MYFVMMILCQYDKSDVSILSIFTLHKNSPVGTSDTSTKYLDSSDNLINVDNCLSSTTSVIDKRKSTNIN